MARDANVDWDRVDDVMLGNASGIKDGACAMIVCNEQAANSNSLTPSTLCALHHVYWRWSGYSDDY